MEPKYSLFIEYLCTVYCERVIIPCFDNQVEDRPNDLGSICSLFDS